MSSKSELIIVSFKSGDVQKQEGSLLRLFNFHKAKWTEDFDDELKDLIAEIKHIVWNAKQEGLRNLEEGK